MPQDSSTVNHRRSEPTYRLQGSQGEQMYLSRSQLYQPKDFKRRKEQPSRQLKLFLSFDHAVPKYSDYREQVLYYRGDVRIQQRAIQRNERYISKCKGASSDPHLLQRPKRNGQGSHIETLISQV